MPIYRMTDSGVFRLFKPTEFQDYERLLEDWVEGNPQLLFPEPDEATFFIGRQTTTAFGKQLDLLGVDQSGATVVVELKRGMTPRDVVAQTLEYAAWVDSLELDELNAISKAYAASKGRVTATVLEAYREAFPSQGAEVDEAIETASRVTFNARQRMLIVAEDFSPELIQTLHYLRTKLGLDIAAVRFTIHRLDDDLLIDTETVVGREPPRRQPMPGAPGIPESPEATRARVQSDFVRDQVDQLPSWLANVGGAEVDVRRGGGSNSSVYVRGKRVLTYYFALRWIHFVLPAPDDAERAVIRQLGPDKVLERPEWVAANVATPVELDLVRPALERRARAEPESLPNAGEERSPER